MCIEDLSPKHELSRFTQCVAVAGAEPGLGLDRRGKVLWQKARVTGCELWVSLDERLMLLRPEGAVPVTVRRAGRSLEVPFDKPVVMLDQDLVELGGKQLRLHFHGEIDDVFAPTPYPLKDTGVGKVVRVAAAAVAIGMAAGPGCGDGQPAPTASGETLEPTTPPPVQPTVDTGPATPPPADTGGQVDAGTPKSGAADKPDPKPIEVRTKPPKIAPPKDWDKKKKKKLKSDDPLGGPDPDGLDL
jgi:hypothetical protein